MSKFLTAAIVAAGLALTPASARAGVITFESTPTGVYGSLTILDATFSFLGGNLKFDVGNAGATGAPEVSNHALVSYFQNVDNAGLFRVDFSVPVFSVQLGVGDFGEDADTVTLKAYTAANVLLQTVTTTIPAGGVGLTGVFLNAGGPNAAAYITFNSTGVFPGSVFWDNLSYNEPRVPEPASLLLIGGGLAGFAARRRRRQA
jgi:hypothetical protein